MRYKNERQLILVIRLALPLLILILSLGITTFLYYENKSDFEKVKSDVENRFISNKKQIVKEQVNNLYNYVLSEQKTIEENLKKSLIQRVNESHKMILNIYNQYKDTHTKEEITKIIRSAIKDIRFNNGRGYFFVYDKKAVNVIHPLLPHLEGKSLINYKDTKGTFVLKESLELLENKDESYQEWYWRKSKTDKKEYKKIGFVKNIYELDWFIGTGEYVEDFSKDMQKTVLGQIERLRFGNDSYFIVTDLQNNYLSHINPKLIGKNAIETLKKLNDYDSIKKIEDVIAKKVGFVYLQFYKPSSNIPISKIIYLKTVPKWDWIISTGFYKKDVKSLIEEEEKRLQDNYSQNMKNLFIIALLSTSVLLLLSFYMSIIIERKFRKYKKDIQHHIDENQKQHELLAQKTKLAAMGEMIENIAHQWRQPLSLITTTSSGMKLQKEMGTLQEQELMKSLDNITQSATHLSDTIDDFRDFFKPDKEMSFFKLNDAIDKTLKLIASQLHDKEINIVKNIQEDITISSFERELLQVLLNILNNAKDALEINDKLKEKYIFIDIYKNDNQACIEIKDNAGGIKEDIIKRIFEPYFTTKHKSQGTGIGLYMSEQIVSRHMDGQISVKNEYYTYKEKEYSGAVFKLTIPIY